jgi:adenosylhomocysteine nucleosidase
MKHLSAIVAGILCLTLTLPSAQAASAFHRIAVIGAFSEEIAAIKEAMLPPAAPVVTHSIHGTEFTEADLGGVHYVFFLSGMSMVNAAMNTQLAIDRFHVDAVVFSGIAGGINPTLQPGDVIVPAQWIHQMESAWLNEDAAKQGAYTMPVWFKPHYGHFGMIFPDDVDVVREGMAKPKRRHTFPADPVLLDAASRAAQGLSLQGGRARPARVVVGDRAMSGPVFLDNAEFRRFARDAWHVDGHDMESTAIAQVCWINKVPVLIVRGLSDLAGGQAGINEEETFGRLAAKNAALVTAKTCLGLSGR